MAKRRGHGEGSIYQRDDGSWSAQVNLGVVGGKRKRRTVSGKTRKEVADKLRRLQQEVDRGITSTANETLGAFLERWLTDVAAQKVKEKTLASYRQQLRSHIIPALGRIKLSKLSAQDVQRMLHVLSETHSARTVAYVRQILSSALDTAERWDLVSRNVARLTEPPRGTKRQGTALTVEQALQLLATADGSYYELAITLAVYTGLRRGEVMGLQWGDIDLDKATLVVRRSIVTIAGKAVASDLKSDSARRSIPLPSTVVAALQRHAEREQVRFGAELRPEDQLFRTSTGAPRHPRNLNHRFQILLERAGLPPVRFHDLRHTAASLLANAGVPMHVAQRILGHSSITLTADIYTHLIGDEQQRAAAAMDALIGLPMLEQ